MKRYKVTIEAQYKAWDDRPTEFTILASSREKAIKQARQRVASMCLYSKEDGRLSYRASEVASLEEIQ